MENSFSIRADIKRQLENWREWGKFLAIEMVIMLCALPGIFVLSALLGALFLPVVVTVLIVEIGLIEMYDLSNKSNNNRF